MNARAQVAGLDFDAPADSPTSYMQDDAFWSNYVQGCWQVSTNACPLLLLARAS